MRGMSLRAGAQEHTIALRANSTALTSRKNVYNHLQRQVGALVILLCWLRRCNPAHGAIFYGDQVTFLYRFNGQNLFTLLHFSAMAPKVIV